jgi:hypothetical protein
MTFCQVFVDISTITKRMAVIVSPVVPIATSNNRERVGPVFSQQWHLNASDRTRSFYVYFKMLPMNLSTTNLTV